MESLVSDWAKILESKEGSDMTIVCSDGVEIKVHSTVLIARSPAFGGMLQSGMIEQSTRRVYVKDFDRSAVEAFVRYLYTAHIGEEFETIVELWKMGNKYLVDALPGDCSKKLSQMIASNNSRALSIGALAETFSSEELMRSCAKSVAKNLAVLQDGWQEDLKDSPRFLMEIISCMKHSSEIIAIRLQPASGKKWNCEGLHADAITVRLNKTATLTSVGLYGTATVREIEVIINVYDDKLQNIYSLSTVYQSTGGADPIQVPVNVKMLAEIGYTVSAYINSQKDRTFSGKEGSGTVKVNDLELKISDSDFSRNNTDSSRGQIPTLGFIIN